MALEEAKKRSLFDNTMLGNVLLPQYVRANPHRTWVGSLESKPPGRLSHLSLYYVVTFCLIPMLNAPHRSLAAELANIVVTEAFDHVFSFVFIRVFFEHLRTLYKW